jgi:hypothetical protein
MARIAEWITSPESKLRPIRAWRPAGAPAFTGEELFEIDMARPSTPLNAPARPGDGTGGAFR